MAMMIAVPGGHGIVMCIYGMMRDGHGRLGMRKREGTACNR